MQRNDGTYRGFFVRLGFKSDGSPAGDAFAATQPDFWVGYELSLTCSDLPDGEKLITATLGHSMPHRERGLLTPFPSYEKAEASRQSYLKAGRELLRQKFPAVPGEPVAQVVETSYGDGKASARAVNESMFNEERESGVEEHGDRKATRERTIEGIMGAIPGVREMPAELRPFLLYALADAHRRHTEEEMERENDPGTVTAETQKGKSMKRTVAGGPVVTVAFLLGLMDGIAYMLQMPHGEIVRRGIAALLPLVAPHKA